MDGFSKAKGMFDVVTGGNITGQTGALIWKYPHNMITSGSILQVMKGQEAVFYKSGSSGFDVLGPGEYPVDTKLIPFLSKVLNVPFGKKTPYTTHIWFVNKTVQFDFPWGTREKVKLEDPKFDDVMLKIGASGDLKIEVQDSAILFEKVVGTMKEYTLEDLETNLKTTVISKITGILQRYATQLRREERAKEDEGEKKSFIDLLGDNEVLAEMIKEEMYKVFELYGIGVVGCAAMLIVEEDDNYKLIEGYSADLLAERKAAKKRRIAAMENMDIEKTRMDKLGYTYHEAREFDVRETFAGNEGNPAAMTAVGLGATLGMAGVVANQMQNVVSPQQQQGYQQPPQGYPPQHGHPPQGYPPPPQGYPPQPQGGYPPPQQGYPPPPQGYPPQQQGYPQQPQGGYQPPPQAIAPQQQAQAPAAQPAEIACPSCGTTQGAVKFCNECGSPMAKKCPGCDLNVESNQKFCNECGTKL